MKDIHSNTCEQSSNINAARAFLFLIIYLGIYIFSIFILEMVLKLSLFIELYKFQRLIIPLWIRRFFSYSTIALSGSFAFFVLFKITKNHFAGARLYTKDILSIGWSRGTLDQILLYAFYGILIFTFFFTLLLVWLPIQYILDVSNKSIFDPSWIKRTISCVTIAPFAEEFIFRGVLLSGFTKSWGKNGHYF